LQPIGKSHSGGGSRVTNAATAPKQDKTPVQVISVSQPVKLDLPLGIFSKPHLAKPPCPPNCSPHAGMIKTWETVKTPVMQSGLATSKLTAAFQNGVEIQQPSVYHIPEGIKNYIGEEEATTCFDSNSEDDCSSCFEPPSIPSIGSAQHGTGMCKPCAFCWKPGGCTNQKNCKYCHFCPYGELKARRKAKIIWMRMGFAMPKSTATRVWEDKKNCNSNLSPSRPEKAMKMEQTQYSGGLHSLLPEVEQSFPASPLQPPPGLQMPAGMPSHGSLLHATGKCKPCAFFWKPGSCQNKQDCMHCHLCPEGEIKTRKIAKVTMMRQKFRHTQKLA